MQTLLLALILFALSVIAAKSTGYALLIAMPLILLLALARPHRSLWPPSIA